LGLGFPRDENVHYRARKRLINSSLVGGARGAFDFFEGDKVDESAFKALILGAVALNTSQESSPATRQRCRPRGSFLDNDVNRRTRTKKYTGLTEIHNVYNGEIGASACNS